MDGEGARMGGDGMRFVTARLSVVRSYPSTCLLQISWGLYRRPVGCRGRRFQRLSSVVSSRGVERGVMVKRIKDRVLNKRRTPLYIEWNAMR